eukprot:NODE_218_length_12464_cov_0.653781.p6 type:complete len:324 gc:universal NODE_218_length_12464_cov_0.653781:11703-10732(-)
MLCILAIIYIQVHHFDKYLFLDQIPLRNMWLFFEILGEQKMQLQPMIWKNSFLPIKKSGWSEYNYKQTNFSSDRLKILSWNIWFDASTSKIRFPKIISEIESTDADIVALQECTSGFLSILSQSPVIQKRYILSGIDDNQFGNWYGCAILIRREIALLNFKKYDFVLTAMGRSLLVATFSFRNLEFSVGTSHFESNEVDFEKRKSQWDQSASLLNNDTSLLCGDFNIYNDQVESDYLYSLGWKDCWECRDKNQIGGNENGFTFGKFQPLKEMDYRRIDRLLFRENKYFKVTDFQFLGTYLISDTIPNLYPSDHLGILVTLTFL